MATPAQPVRPDLAVRSDAIRIDLIIGSMLSHPRDSGFGIVNLSREGMPGSVPVVDADGDDIALARELTTGIPGYGALASAVSTAVNPEQHRSLAAIRSGRRDVERQAVFIPAHLSAGGEPT